MKLSNTRYSLVIFTSVMSFIVPILPLVSLIMGIRCIKYNGLVGERIVGVISTVCGLISLLLHTVVIIVLVYSMSSAGTEDIASTGVEIETEGTTVEIAPDVLDQSEDSMSKDIDSVLPAIGEYGVYSFWGKQRRETENGY